MLSATSVTPGEKAGSPFQRPGLWARVAPFAVVAVLAEASLGLTSASESGPAVLASVLLLLLSAAGFLLPWPRLPGWMPVLVPLTYTASVLALDLAAGSTSGVGIVILIPLVWTALFHRRWESVCVVAAIVTTEVIVSLTPVAVPDAVIVRRAIFWTALGALISIATHGLRDRIQRSQERTAQLQSRLRELTVLADRDRIAADLRESVIQRIFTVGLRLQSVMSRAPRGEVRDKITASVDDLDEAVRMLRDAIFGLEQRPTDRSLRQEIMDLCAHLSPAPEVSFSGPVDTVAAEHQGAVGRDADRSTRPGPGKRRGRADRHRRRRRVLPHRPGGRPDTRAAPRGTRRPAGGVFHRPSGLGRRSRDSRRRGGHPRWRPGGLAGPARLAGARGRIITLAPAGGAGPTAAAGRSAAVQRAVQVHGRADQGQVGQRLREVAQRLPEAPICSA